MSFPILRADLNDVSSPKLNLESVELPESSSFIEKRVLTLSKQIVAAAAEGKKTVRLHIVVAENVEPVSSGLKVNFPDVTFTIEGNADETPGGRGRIGRGTPVVVDWN
jgi:hypothetical protein